MKSPYHILVVEDNEVLASAIANMLKGVAAYEVSVVHSLTAAMQLSNLSTIDLIIQDRMLGDGDGIDFIAHIRKTYPSVRVLFLSVKSASHDRIQGLKAGGDDYLAKPFDSEELILRVKKQLSNLPEVAVGGQKKQYVFGNNKIYINGNKAINCRQEEIILTDLEMNVLHFFMKHAKKVVTREYLFKTVWGGHYNTQSRVIDNHIVRMRKLFEADPQHPKHFVSKRNVGYVFYP